MYEDLKIRYRQQEETHAGTVTQLNSKCESLEKQLSEFVIVNETLRQRVETNQNSESVQTSDAPPPQDKEKCTSDVNCSVKACYEDDDEHKFECIRCKKLFHYGCTKMPTYQIAHFLTPNYRRYICINCTQIPEYVTEVMKNKDDLHSTASQEKNRLTEELDAKTTEIDRVNDTMIKHQNENKQQKERIQSMENDETEQHKKMKQQGALINHLRAQASKKPTENLSKAPVNLDTIQEDASVNTLDAKLEAFSSNILSKVTRIMDDKLEALKAATPVPPGSSSEPLENSNSPNTWSAIVSQPQDLRSMMRDARNDEKIELTEKQRRATNIIIHGAEEVGENPNGIKKEDLEYVKQIFTKIGVSSTPTSITRLGQPNESKSRPLKIVMKSANEKADVMKNLGRLKGTERYFGKISVKDDYTSSEREEIRLLTERAKKETAENPEKVFKVRGNSKNGWRVVSFQKN